MAGRRSSDIPKRYTGARDTTFARSAGNNWIPNRDIQLFPRCDAQIVGSEG